MKRTTTLLAAILLILSLCSCAKQNADVDKEKETDQNPPVNETEQEENDNISISDIADELIQSGSFPDMYVMNNSEIERQFDLSIDTFSEVYASAADQYPGIERIFISKLNDKEDMDTVADALNQYLETLKAEYIDYVPSEYEKAKDVSVYKKGLYVCLVVSQDSEASLDIVKEYIK